MWVGFVCCVTVVVEFGALWVVRLLVWCVGCSGVVVMWAEWEYCRRVPAVGGNLWSWRSSWSRSREW